MENSIIVRLRTGACICAAVAILMLLITAFQATNAEAIPLTTPIDYYGKSIDLLVLLGQDRIGETGRNKVGPNGIYHASGVLVDSSAPADKLYIYVVDTGNNRILGIDYSCEISGTCQMDGTRPASIVLGQPDMTTASCNGDNNLGFNQSPTSSTLCLLGYPFCNNTAEYWMRSNIDLDSQGNLYVPDVWNNRVLKFNQPFSQDTANGKGDSIADFVWGQDDMTSNGRNRSSNYGVVNPPDDHSLWISFGPPDHVSSRGVSVDGGGNVWVADTFNNRVLRFPPDSKQADLVLGQPDFTSSGCAPNGPLNRMCTPTLAKVHPTTGDLYVLDEYPAPFRARLLEFTAPFTNGMSATRVITPNQDGPFTNWDGWDGTGAYMFQSTGFVFNTFREGEYADGEIWLNEHSANRALLIDLDGEIIKVVGAKDKYSRGGDVSFIGCSGDIYTGNYLWWPGGSIGLDNANNIYLADEVFHTVFRYALPYETHQEGSAVCLPEANGVLLPKGPNQRSSDRLGESVGLAVFGNQLLVRDEGMRMKVYNDYLTKSFGTDADHVLTGGFQARNWLSGGIDDANRLWLSGEHGQIRIYQLPITGSTTAPIADFVKLYWADTGAEVTRPDGVNYVQVGAMAFDQNQHTMYIADAVNTRIFRVSNYDEFTDTLYVDMVIGQRDKTEVRCNQGLGAPNAETLCAVSTIKFDRQGNLFVIDNAYECAGNQRIVVFAATDLNSATTLFPNLQASKVFNAPDFDHLGNCAYGTVDQPGSPVSLAFNSRNQMVVGNDGYYGDAEQRQLGQLWFYSDPLNKQMPDASIALYMGTPGEITFDQYDNLMIQDHTWYKVWVINLDTDPEWLEYLPGAPTVADFKATPTGGVFPLTVVFSNISINYTSSLWEFGDGLTSTLKNPTHTYTEIGAYTVTLTVSGPGGTDIISHTNYITTRAPIPAQAAFTAAPTFGFAPLTVVFTNTSSGDYDISLWEFGDGLTSTLQSPTHTYMMKGAYTVTLTVNRELSETNTLTRTNYISVEDSYFTYLPLVLSTPRPLLELHFEDSFTGADGEYGTADGVTFASGYNGQGALFDGNDTLIYAADGNINVEQGNIEFWLKPLWSGNDGESYVFFEIGDAWFNRMRITKDGANNFRFMVWSADTEYGVAYNVSAWNADEWHQVRVTWEENEIALYLDGTLRDVETGIALPAYLDTTLYLGSTSGGYTQAQAVLDEFAIYSQP